jgi:hypothetical protein
MLVHACNTSTGNAESAGSQIQGQPRLHIDTLSQIKKKKNNLTDIQNVKH